MNDNQAEDYHDWGKVKPSRSPKCLSFILWYVVFLLILGAAFTFKAQFGGYLTKLYQLMGG